LAALLSAALSYAPQLTRLWGSYRAFVALITIVAIVSLIFVRSDAILAVTILGLAAIWTPLVAKGLKLLD
jgi:hypothetical protein